MRSSNVTVTRPSTDNVLLSAIVPESTTETRRLYIGFASQSKVPDTFKSALYSSISLGNNLNAPFMFPFNKLNVGNNSSTSSDTKVSGSVLVILQTNISSFSFSFTLQATSGNKGASLTLVNFTLACAS